MAEKMLFNNDCLQRNKVRCQAILKRLDLTVSTQKLYQISKQYSSFREALNMKGKVQKDFVKSYQKLIWEIQCLPIIVDCDPVVISSSNSINRCYYEDVANPITTTTTTSLLSSTSKLTKKENKHLIRFELFCAGLRARFAIRDQSQLQTHVDPLLCSTCCHFFADIDEIKNLINTCIEKSEKIPNSLERVEFSTPTPTYKKNTRIYLNSTHALELFRCLFLLFGNKKLKQTQKKSQQKQKDQEQKEQQQQNLTISYYGIMFSNMACPGFYLSKLEWICLLYEFYVFVLRNKDVELYLSSVLKQETIEKAKNVFCQTDGKKENNQLLPLQKQQQQQQQQQQYEQQQYEQQQKQMGVIKGIVTTATQTKTTQNTIIPTANAAALMYNEVLNIKIPKLKLDDISEFQESQFMKKLLPPIKVDLTKEEEEEEEGDDCIKNQTTTTTTESKLVLVSDHIHNPFFSSFCSSLLESEQTTPDISQQIKVDANRSEVEKDVVMCEMKMKTNEGTIALIPETMRFQISTMCLCEDGKKDVPLKWYMIEQYININNMEKRTQKVDWIKRLVLHVSMDNDFDGQNEREKKTTKLITFSSLLDQYFREVWFEKHIISLFVIYFQKLPKTKNIPRDFESAGLNFYNQLLKIHKLIKKK